MNPTVAGSRQPTEAILEMPLTYRITTLGCRVNHAETRDLESVLRSRGLVRAEADRKADLEVVHTCSVTASASAKSRNAIRRAARRGQHSAATRPPDCEMNGEGWQGSAPVRSTIENSIPYRNSQLIVTGCFAATDSEEACRLIGDASAVIGHDGDRDSTLSDRFARRVDQWLETRPDPPQRPRETGKNHSDGVLPLPVVEPAGGTGGHVRAELRIQDGCDAHCTFCIIPSIRRVLRSKTIADTVAEARRLVELGHPEIVLSGIFIGAYGHQTALRRRQRKLENQPLADLLDEVAHVPGLARLRISSMEPGDVTEPLLEAMVANMPVVVPHLHLPLQSGSDAVLRRMNRQYRVGEYLEMVDKVNEALTTSDGLPPAITTDIICGFPGETEEDFQRTVQVAEPVGYLHMHVFPYSPRPGTAAARWTDQHLPAAVVKERVKRLIDLENDLEQGLSIQYRRRLLGRTVRVILEQPLRDNESVMTGRCDHYALISIPTDLPRGSVVSAEVNQVTADHTLGSIVRGRVSLSVL